MILIGLAGRAGLCEIISRIIVVVAEKSMQHCLVEYFTFLLLMLIGVAQEVWLHLCKLLYQLAECCSIQEEGLMKTTALQPLPPALERILATLLTITDTIQYDQVIVQYSILEFVSIILYIRKLGQCRTFHFLSAATKN